MFINFLLISTYEKLCVGKAPVAISDKYLTKMCTLQYNGGASIICGTLHSMTINIMDATENSPNIVKHWLVPTQWHSYILPPNPSTVVTYTVNVSSESFRD